MSTFDLHPELADRLEALFPPDASPADWEDVVRRVRPVRRLSRPRSFGLKLAVALAVSALLVGIASATYVLLHHSKSVQPTPGALTYTADGHCNCRYAKVEEVVPNAPPRVVWHCPGNRYCGSLTSVDWSPDGRHLALTLDAFQAKTPSLGLHIVDVSTRRDIHVLPASGPLCVAPTEVAWSPDGGTLAFGCAGGRIYTVRSDGKRLRLLPTGIAATAPAWSSDGTRIAFSDHGSIYVIGVNGVHPRLVVQHGDAPDWSPDGKTIAYRSAHGVAFVTPSGAPSSRKPLAIRGVPSWSSDGSKLAVEATGESIYVSEGGRAPLPATPPVDGPFAWYPTTHVSTCRAC